MSAEKYPTYADAFREFRMNIAENDFHDDYPETAEMTLAITIGLRYHYIHNYHLLTTDQTVQLIETFSKRCDKLDNYKHILNGHHYNSESIIMHTHWSDKMNPGADEFLLLCYAYGLITLTYEQQHNIYQNLAYRTTWAKRNTIQLKTVDKDIKRRNELQQKLNDMGKLANSIDNFNHIYKYTRIPSIDRQTGERSYKYVIDSHYDGHIDENLGTDTIYEWILNDDVDRFQQWYNDGGLQEYSNGYRNNDRNLEYRKNIADHILSSNAVKILRYIIMNNLHEFLDKPYGMWALMDPWRCPVNNPEFFRLLQERFTKEHDGIVAEFIDSGYDDYDMVGHVYRFIRPEIAEAIYQEIMEISSRLYGTDDIYLRLYVAIEMAKFGHIGPIESLDWETITKTLSDKNKSTIKAEHVLLKLVQLMQSRRALMKEHCECLPFGMNPSTAVYIHDLFSENGLVRIALSDQLLDKYCDEGLLVAGIDRENPIVMLEYEEDEWVCTDDELY